jgi:hypothetical protein
MRSSIIYLFSLLVLSGLLPRSTSAQNVKGGLAGGSNFTQVEGDNTHGFYHVGIHAGGFAALPLSSKFTLSVELLYTQKGATTIAGNDIGFALSYDLDLDYIEAPVLFNYHDKQRINAGIGPAIGVLVRDEETIREPKHEFQEEYPYESLDVSVVVNGEYPVSYTALTMPTTSHV